MTENKSDVDVLLDQIKATSGSLTPMNEKIIDAYTQEVADLMMSHMRRYKDFGMAQATGKFLIEAKKAYWPATQKTVQTIDTWSDKLNQWIQARKNMNNANDAEKEMSVIIKSVEDETNG